MSIYLGLGSNIENPVIQLETAITEIARLPETSLVCSSQFYWNSFEGGVNEPECLNAVIEISTSLNPLVLLDLLQHIENQHGRTRKFSGYSSRTLDIDVLLFNNEIILFENLIIPHPHMQTRGFVLFPLFEIAPNLILPTGEKVADLIKKISWNGKMRE